MALTFKVGPFRGSVASIRASVWRLLLYRSAHPRDFRGVFVADAIKGKSTIIAQADTGRYAFFRGEEYLGPREAAQQAGQQEAGAPAAPSDQTAKPGSKGKLLEQIFEDNDAFNIQQKQRRQSWQVLKRSRRDTRPLPTETWPDGSIVVRAKQFFFDLVRLPGNGSEHARYFQRVGGFRQLVGLNDDHVAAAFIHNSECSVHDLGVVAEQFHGIFLGRRAADRRVRDHSMAFVVLLIEAHLNILLSERSDWNCNMPNVVASLDGIAARLSNGLYQRFGIDRRGRQVAKIVCLRNCCSRSDAWCASFGTRGRFELIRSRLASCDL